MSEKYLAAMQYVTLSAAARQRILTALEQGTAVRTRRTVAFRAAKRLLSAAACVALLAAGLLLVPGLLHHASQPVQPPVSDSFGVTECAGLEELSAAAGFAVKEPPLPFVPQSAQYTCLGSLAQIAYTAGDSTALYRQSAGSEDNSGDYNSYPSVVTTAAGPYTLTLKGENGSYTLALWSDGSCAFSLALSEGLTPQQWSELLAKS